MNLPPRFTLQVPPGFDQLSWLQTFVNRCVQNGSQYRQVDGKLIVSPEFPRAMKPEEFARML